MAEQQALSFRKRITRTVGLRYLLALPKGYEGSGANRWPLILFLHGAGERGDDLELVKKHGIPKVVAQGTIPDFPFIAVSPQCPTDGWWHTQVEALSALLDEVEGAHRVDSERIYLTGLSMGGYGTWALAVAEPHRFAAIAPVCGGGDPRGTRRIPHLPAWVFHGARDETVPLLRSAEMVQALARNGGYARFTVYPEAKHDSWTETYNNPELYTWLLSHTRVAKAEPGAAVTPTPAAPSTQAPAAGRAGRAPAPATEDAARARRRASGATPARTPAQRRAPGTA